MATICYEGLPGKVGRCVVWPPLPGHPTGEYGAGTHLLVDFAVVDGINQAAKNVTDDGTRAALQSGVDAAVKALKARAGDQVKSLKLTE